MDVIDWDGKRQDMFGGKVQQGEVGQFSPNNKVDQTVYHIMGAPI